MLMALVNAVHHRLSPIDLINRYQAPRTDLGEAVVIAIVIGYELEGEEENGNEFWLLKYLSFQFSPFHSENHRCIISFPAVLPLSRVLSNWKLRRCDEKKNCKKQSHRHTLGLHYC